MAAMFQYLILFCMFSVLEVSGNGIPENKEHGGEMDILLARIDSLEKQHREESNTMKQQLEGLKEESSYMKQQLEELKVVNGWQQKRIEDLETILQDEKKDQHTNGDEGNSSIPQKRASEAQRTKGIRQAQSEMSVSFFATLSNHLSHIGAKHNIAFEHVVTNEGNAYNPHTGVFTAPVTGTYVFSSTVTVHTTSSTHVGFTHNGDVITWMNINGSNKPYDSSSDTIVLQLNQGDDVTVQNLIDSNVNLYGANHSLISGFLLYI